MEWSKIKTLFIYLFLVLNIVLATSYGYVIYKNNTEVYKEKDEIIKSITNDDIEIVEPYLKRDQLGYINASIKKSEDIENNLENYSYENISEDDVKKLRITVEKDIANVGSSNYKELLDAFISAELGKVASYVYSSYDADKQKIIYVQQIDDLKILDNANAQIVFDVKEDGGINSFDVTALDDFKKEKSESLANYTQAVHKLYHENNIPKNSKVTTQLGYYTYAYKVNNQVLIPTYQVIVDTAGVKSYYFIDAINLKVLEQTNK